MEKPINSGLFEREHGCPTRGVGRTPTMFHNTLVVGSSPTDSTTQSPPEKRLALPWDAKLGMSGRGHRRMRVVVWGERPGGCRA